MTSERYNGTKESTKGGPNRNGTDDALGEKGLTVICQEEHEIVKVVTHIAVLVRILELWVEEEGCFAERADGFE